MRKVYFKSELGLNIDVSKVYDKKISSLPSGLKNSSRFVKNANSILNDPGIDIVVELIGGIKDARLYIKNALKNGKHVVTANKALLAQDLGLFNVARKNKRIIKFEASVGGSIPIIQAIQKSFVADDIISLYGIVNGTSNYILSHMQQHGCSFKDALKEAQQKGYAEKNPRLDIEGIDSLHKLTILANLCFGTRLKHNNIYCEGISCIQYSDIQYADELGYRVKLLAIAKKIASRLELRVHPTLVREDHLLSSVRGIYNAIYIESTLAGKTLLFGKGAGGTPAGDAVVSDIIDIACSVKNSGMDIEDEAMLKKKVNLKLKNVKDISTRYYIRFMAIDKPGVLAKISDILGKCNISISSVTQKERKKTKIVPIVMITHEAGELNLQNAIGKIKKLNIIKNNPVVMRIENWGEE